MILQTPRRHQRLVDALRRDLLPRIRWATPPVRPLPCAWDRQAHPVSRLWVPAGLRWTPGQSLLERARWWARTSTVRILRLLHEQAGAAGDVKLTYAASAAQTQTNLDGLASSATWVAGWESGAIDNSANLYLDYIINAKIQVESAGLSAGEIRMYLVAELDDTTWPDVFDGTESAETITDTEVRDAICRPAAATATDTTASRTYYLNCPSARAVFGGTLPRKFVIFITQSTGTTLETTADPNQVYVKGVYANIAA